MDQCHPQDAGGARLMIIEGADHNDPRKNSPYRDALPAVVASLPASNIHSEISQSN